jgi:CHAT domain-containing protein
MRLVVLAGCSTANGKVWDSEGVANLGRPFLAAGVPTVVASLWQVGDRASFALLDEFYGRLRAGADPGSALRQAQASMIHHTDPALRSPRSWAAFSLVGATPGSAGRPGRP